MSGGDPVTVMRMSRQDLDAQREAILKQVGISCDELARRAASRSLVGDEWAAWDEIRDIDFLLNG